MSSKLLTNTEYIKGITKIVKAAATSKYIINALVTDLLDFTEELVIGKNTGTEQAVLHYIKLPTDTRGIAFSNYTLLLAGILFVIRLDAGKPSELSVVHAPNVFSETDALLFAGMFSTVYGSEQEEVQLAVQRALFASKTAKHFSIANAGD